MPKPILVGYDPRSADRAPVRFGVAAARFTGAPLLIGSVFDRSIVLGQMGHEQMGGQTSDEAALRREPLRRELGGERVRAECELVGGASPPAGLHAVAEQ